MPMTYIVLHAKYVIVVFVIVISFLFADLITEHLKVRRKAQEAKRQAEEDKQEAEQGSAKMATEGLSSQLEGDDHQNKEPQEDPSTQGKNSVIFFSFYSEKSSSTMSAWCFPMCK